MTMIQVFVSDRFQKDIRKLQKRYRNIRQDIEPFIQQLQAGELPGDRISGVDASVFKVRLRNRDNNKGKRAGYRVIYYLQMSDRIFLITLYSKADQGDISTVELINIINALPPSR